MRKYESFFRESFCKEHCRLEKIAPYEYRTVRLNLLLQFGPINQVKLSQVALH